MRIFQSFIAVMAITFATVANAAVMYLSPGSTKELHFDEKIDTIFVTNNNVASYKILADKTLILYGLNPGSTDIAIYAKDQKTLLNDKVVVNDLGDFIVDASNQVKIHLPKTKLQVVKTGSAYVIEGEAQSQEELEKAKRIVAASVNSPVEKNTRDLDGEGLGQNLLTKYDYQNVISNAKVVEPRQVNVRLTVVEINRNLVEQLGINWDKTGQIAGSWGNFLGGLTGGKINISVDSMKGFISALNNRDNAKVLAEPNLSLLSGEKAEVLIGGEIPFIQYDKDGNPTVIYKDYGINLKVAAKMQDNGNIRIALHQEVSDIVSDRAESGQVMPMLSTTKSKSMFEVANGQSFIIGGLYNNKRSETLSKMPLLGDVPILGAFFRSAETKGAEKELLIVATVNLVKPVNGDEITYPNFEETGTLARFFNVTPIQHLYQNTQVHNFLERGGFIQ